MTKAPLHAETVTSRIRVPWRAWYQETNLLLDFPSRWEVQVCEPLGATPLTADEIAQTLNCPEGALPLEKAVAGQRSVVIVVEDITRPTPTAQLLPAVLNRLRAGGIELARVRILVALGAHGPMSAADIRLKLGSSVDLIEVLQHDPKTNLIYIGETRRKTQVYVNRYLLEADFRLSLGTILPHPFCGFSGGAKLIIPGLAGVCTVERNHTFPRLGLGVRPGMLEPNPIRAEIEEATDLLRLDWIADTLINTRREIVNLHCGHPKHAHRRGCMQALRIYSTRIPNEPADVLVLNAFPKDTELLQIGNAFNVLRSSNRPLVRPDGIVAVCAACPRGVGAHLLFEKGGPLYVRPRPRYFRGGRHLALISPGILERDFRLYYGREDLFFTNWNDFCVHLEKKFPNGGKATVLPAASLQIAV